MITNDVASFQLIPCKICGGDARIAIDRNHLYYGVCKECGFNLAGTEIENTAISLWNYYNNPRLYEEEIIKEIINDDLSYDSWNNCFICNS